MSETESIVESIRKLAVVDVSPIEGEEEWFQRGRDAYAIFMPRIPLSRYRAFLETAKQLKMIQTPSVGYNHIDIAACTERSIIVSNVADIMAESVAQHTWALILSVSKNVVKSDRVLRSGGWLHQERFGVELYGKTLGVIGLGAIGGRIALKGSLAYGMRILAYDPYVLPARAQLYDAQLVDLDTLLRESDVISIACPLTAQTHHLMDAGKIKLVKSSAILVNTARGPIIEEKALIEALRNQKLFGAGLDVFEEEPLSQDSPLLSMDNVVLTAHIGSSTRIAFDKTFKGAVGNILRFLRGERPHWIVNPSAYKVT
jgi:lactate dehydrogenase-like 2-hydroxyacid dehydrogenase